MLRSLLFVVLFSFLSLGMSSTATTSEISSIDHPQVANNDDIPTMSTTPTLDTDRLVKFPSSSAESDAGKPVGASVRAGRNAERASLQHSVREKGHFHARFHAGRYAGLHEHIHGEADEPQHSEAGQIDELDGSRMEVKPKLSGLIRRQIQTYQTNQTNQTNQTSQNIQTSRTVQTTQTGVPGLLVGFPRETSTTPQSTLKPLVGFPAADSSQSSAKHTKTPRAEPDLLIGFPAADEVQISEGPSTKAPRANPSQLSTPTVVASGGSTETGTLPEDDSCEDEHEGKTSQASDIRPVLEVAMIVIAAIWAGSLLLRVLALVLVLR